MICYLDSRHRSQQQLVEQLERMEETRVQREAIEAEAQREQRRQEEPSKNTCGWMNFRG